MLIIYVYLFEIYMFEQVVVDCTYVYLCDCMCYVTACGCNCKSLTRSENSECMYRTTSRGTGRFKKLSSPVSGVHGGWKQESSRVTGQRHFPESEGDRLTIVANEEFI